MNLSLAGHHVEITPPIRQYLEGKLDRVLRHFDDVTTVNVVLSVEKLQQKAAATIHVRGRDLHAEAVDQDMYASIDALADKLDREVIRHKEKHQNHHGAGLKRQPLAD
jgi:putative sigma-54 modulation protein